MSYKIEDMTPKGKDLLEKMKNEVSNFEDLMVAISVGVAIKKFFDHPVSQILDLVIPSPNEWDVLTELLRSSDGLKGILKKKINIHWYKYQTHHDWNNADKAFIESLYNSINRS